MTLSVLPKAGDQFFGPFFGRVRRESVTVVAQFDAQHICRCRAKDDGAIGLDALDAVKAMRTSLMGNGFC